MKKLFMSLVMLGLVAGCGSTPKDKEGAAVEDRKPPSESVDRPGVKPAESKPLTDKPYAGGPLNDPNNILSKRTVYFDFDSSLVKEEFRPVVSAHARYLQQNSGAKMRIEGNTDERGSREYNLALGQRRADAVRQMMQLLGARSIQIETVSFGEEKPRSAGHDEAAWAENRRADIVYQGEQGRDL